MKTITVLLLCLTCIPSWACSQTDADADRRDRLFQRKLVAEYAESADFIYIADVKHIDVERSTVELEVVEQFKGTPVTVQLALYDDQPKWVLVCAASYYFQTMDIALGQRYVIYSKDGKLLQASAVERTREFISLRDETRIIKKSVSNKPLKNDARKSARAS